MTTHDHHDRHRRAKLALGVLDAINGRDLERIRDLVTDDFVDHGSPVPLPPGPDGYIAILTFVTEVLQIRYTIEDVVASGDDRGDPRDGARRARRGASRHRSDGPSLRDEDRPLLPVARRAALRALGHPRRARRAVPGRGARNRRR